jgi:hypothetical protein
MNVNERDVAMTLSALGRLGMCKGGREGGREGEKEGEALLLLTLHNSV